MKILVLFIITTWSFGTPIINPVSKQIVGSPQTAAVVRWENERKSDMFIAGRDQYDYKLYEIDVEKGTIKEVAIPKLKFTSPADSGTPEK